jgi:hypothetical protein
MLHFEIKVMSVVCETLPKKITEGLNYRTFEMETSHAHFKVFS